MYTHVVTDETPWENHLPDCAVSLVRQVLLNWIWLHKLTSCKPRISLPDQILIASTWPWQKDVIYSSAGFQNYIWREKQFPVSLVTANHANTVLNGHFSEATFRIKSSPDFNISGISAILTLSTRSIFLLFSPDLPGLQRVTLLGWRLNRTKQQKGSH